MKYIKLFKSHALQEAFLTNETGEVARPHFSFCDATDDFGLDSDVADYVEPEPLDPSSGGDNPGGEEPLDPSSGGENPGGDEPLDPSSGGDNPGGGESDEPAIDD